MVILKDWKTGGNLDKKLRSCNVNGPVLSVHSDLMCLWDCVTVGWFWFFLAESGRFWGDKTRAFLLSWVLEVKKPKPFYLIEFSLGDFVN